MDIKLKLNEIVVRLYKETADYKDNPSDVQLWYNRGYANGVISVLREMNSLSLLESELNIDEIGLYHEERLMEWFKAYHHGFEMGMNEAREVLPA